MVGLAAVQAQWRRVLDEDWEWAKPLLRSTDELAGWFSRESHGRNYRVICHDEEKDDYVGVDPENPSERIPLTRADLVVWELDFAELSVLVANALSATVDAGAVPALPYAYRVAVHDPLGVGETWMYLTTSSEPSEVSRSVDGLAARHARSRFVLLTPTRSAWRGWPEAIRGRGVVVAMDEVFEAGADAGKLVAIKRVDDLFAALGRSDNGISRENDQPVHLAGMLRFEAIRKAHPELNATELDRLQKRLKRWRERNEDQVITSDENPDTGRRRYAYPAEIVSGFVKHILGERSHRS